MRSITSVVAAVLFMAAPAFGNILVNEGFDSPKDPPAACTENVGPADTWIKVNNGTGVEWLRNSGFFGQDCPPDGFYATMQHGDRQGGYVYQTASVTSGTHYKVSFRWANLVFGGSPLQRSRFSVELRSGSNPTGGTLLGSISEEIQGDSHGWEEKSFVAQATSNEVTVVWRIDKVSGGFADFLVGHMDYLRLEEATCIDPPTLDPTMPIMPDLGVRGQPVNVTITGTNFAAPITAKLVRGAEVIDGTSVVVNSSTSLSATFNIPANAAPGRYNLVVEKQTTPPCDPVSAGAAFLVYLPSLSNASFEDDPAVACEPTDLTPALPKDWQGGETGAWGFANILNLNGYVRITDTTDGVLPVLPTCPPPDGDHYGTIGSLTTAVGANARVWQTIAVNAGSDYTFSGFFAGTGNNNAVIRLRDGDRDGPVLGTKTINNTLATYDWRFDFVSGTASPGSEAMTVEIAIARQEGDVNAIHMDALAFEVCDGATPVINSITPDDGVNDGVVSVSISGSGFGGTPVVMLSKAGALITATNVQVVSSTQITCDFDLTGVSSGPYDVIIKQGGCISAPAGLAGRFLVVGAAFVNGDFELPDVGPVDCGPPPQGVVGTPTGWNSDAPNGLIRDGNAPVPPTCPSPAGGHYGTMSHDGGGVLRAWQTVRVVPNSEYTFGGYFSGGGDVHLRLLNDDESGTELGSQVVFLGGDGGAWVHGEVSAVATSNVMTVVWEISNAPAVAPGGHADGLTFEGDECNNPVWADADDDGDVDHDDFAIFQRCYTGPAGTLHSIPEYPCACFDRNADGRIDETDFAIFSACVGGPSVPVTSCP